MNIDNFELKNKLGSGMFGTVYLATYKNRKKNYAIKIEKIAKDNIKYNINTQDWREIEFSIKFANKYPDQFITLYTFDVVDDCKHIQEYANNKIPQHLPQNIITRLEEKQSSKYCIRKVYSLLDTSLGSIIDTLKPENFYSLIAQISYCVFLMHKHGYTHNDLHSQNIGVLYVNKNKKIKIDKYKIPTFGYQFKAIDFGNVLNSKYKLDKDDKKKYKFNMKNELLKILSRLVAFESSDLKIKRKLINREHYPLVYEKIIKHPLFKKIKKLVFHKEDGYIIFQIIFPEEYQKVFYDGKDEQILNPVLKIELNDIIFLLNNKENYKKIIKFCYEKIKQ